MMSRRGLLKGLGAAAAVGAAGNSAAAGLDAIEERRLALMRAQYDVPSLTEFQALATPRRPVPKHLRLLHGVLDRTRHESVFAVVRMPPRHVKSVSGLNHIARGVLYDPALTHAFIGYEQKFAERKGLAARAYANQYAHYVPQGPRLLKDPEQWDRTFWKTSAGGGVMCTGIGGALTGEGITGCAFVDDPVKNRQQAESAVYKQHVWDWFVSTCITRLEPGASCIVVQTQWATDDLAGRLIRGEHNDDAPLEERIDFEDIRIPALAEENDPLGREPGEALWPEQYPVEWLRRMRRLDEWNFQSLYQQDPRPRGGALFGAEPARFELRDFRLEGHRVAICTDTAYTDKASSDYSCIGAVAMIGSGEEARMYLLDWWRGQVKIEDFCSRLRDWQARWRVPILVESNGPQKAVAGMLRAQDRSLQIVEWIPKGSKFTRAQVPSSAWKQGRILIPVGVPWAKDLLEEIQAFTGIGDRRDDQVDTLTQGFNFLLSPPVTARRGSVRVSPF